MSAMYGTLRRQYETSGNLFDVGAYQLLADVLTAHAAVDARASDIRDRGLFCHRDSVVCSGAGDR